MEHELKPGSNFSDNNVSNEDISYRDFLTAVASKQTSVTLPQLQAETPQQIHCNTDSSISEVNNLSSEAAQRAIATSKITLNGEPRGNIKYRQQPGEIPHHLVILSPCQWMLFIVQVCHSPVGRTTTFGRRYLQQTPMKTDLHEAETYETQQ